jgi:hypothetical protein
MITVELTAAIDAAGTLQTFYLSTDNFVTSPTDTPANTAFSPVLIDPGSIGLHAFSDGRTGGATKLEIGEISVANADGGFDGWLDYSFDGRPAVIRVGDGGVYPGSFYTLLTATVESIEISWKQVVVRLRDKQWKFDRPLVTNRYGGTNVLPGGIDGTAADIRGQAKPRVYGKVLNVAPVCVNTSKLIYQVSERPLASIDGVYDGASAVPFNAVYANSAALLAATTPAGKYDSCPSEGLIKFSTAPTYGFTVDATASGAKTAAAVLNQIAVDVGVPSAEISSDDISTLAADNPAVVGIFINDADTTATSAMDEVAASVSAWYGFDKDGVLRMGRLSDPSGDPVVILQDFDVGDTIERRPLRDNGVPCYRVTVNHSKNYTVQTSGIAGAVTAARRAVVALPSLSEKAEDASVQTQWLMAKENTFLTLLTASADAAAEASRLLALYKAPRSLYEVPVDISVLVRNGLKLMDVVGMTLGRFGMDTGKNFRLLGVRLELSRALVTLTLWG